MLYSTCNLSVSGLNLRSPRDMDLIRAESKPSVSQGSGLRKRLAPLRGSSFGQGCLVAHAEAQEAGLSDHDAIIDAEPNLG